MALIRKCSHTFLNGQKEKDKINNFDFKKSWKCVIVFVFVQWNMYILDNLTPPFTQI